MKIIIKILKYTMHHHLTLKQKVCFIPFYRLNKLQNCGFKIILAPNTILKFTVIHQNCQMKKHPTGWEKNLCKLSD